MVNRRLGHVRTVLLARSFHAGRRDTGRESAKVPALYGNLGLSRVQDAVRRGTSRVKSLTRTSRPLVTADGTGIVSHAGAALLRELADESGLTHG